MRIGPIALAVLLSLSLAAGCSVDSAQTKNSSPVTAGSQGGVLESGEETAEGNYPGKVYHKMGVGETAAIHYLRVTVTSAKDGPVSVGGRPTFVIHVRYEEGEDAVGNEPDSGTSTTVSDWELEYINGKRSGQIASVSAPTQSPPSVMGSEGDIYFVKKGDVAKVVYTPSIFDWYPEVTTWDVR